LKNKYPEDEDRDGLRNVGFFTAQPFDLADSPRELHHTKKVMLGIPDQINMLYSTSLLTDPEKYF
jgi:hypothetical protein